MCSESPCTHSVIISALLTNSAHIFWSVYAALMVNSEMASNWLVLSKKAECKTHFIIACSTFTIKSKFIHHMGDCLTIPLSNNLERG